MRTHWVTSDGELSDFCNGGIHNFDSDSFTDLFICECFHILILTFLSEFIEYTCGCIIITTNGAKDHLKKKIKKRFRHLFDASRVT